MKNSLKALMLTAMTTVGAVTQVYSATETEFTDCQKAGVATQFINEYGIVTDAEMLATLDVFRETHAEHMPADNNAKDVDTFMQLFWFQEDCEIFDRLNKSRQLPDVINNLQAGKLFQLMNAKEYADFVPQIAEPSSITVVVLLGLVKPTIDMRFEDLTKLTKALTGQGHSVGEIVLACPGTISLEMRNYVEGYVQGYVKGIKYTELFGCVVGVLYSSVSIGHNEANLNTVAGLLAEDAKVVILTADTFYSKMEDIAQPILGDKYKGAAYFYMNETTKATNYGFNITTAAGLTNWVACELNCNARTFHKHYETWSKANPDVA